MAKLLNVIGMTRGKRDGILKTEKIKNVVKVGSMNLKGFGFLLIEHMKLLEMKVLIVYYTLYLSKI